MISFRTGLVVAEQQVPSVAALKTDVIAGNGCQALSLLLLLLLLLTFSQQLLPLRLGLVGSGSSQLAVHLQANET